MMQLNFERYKTLIMQIGICHLCGKEKELTFEHIPPKGANNKTRAKLITGNEIFDLEKLKNNKSLRYINQQQGSGGYTLCDECNNNTGAWYAKDYIEFANVIGYYLNNETNLDKAEQVSFYIEGLHGQRIFKQILSMFLSTIQPEVVERMQDIQEFVLDKDSMNFNKEKYRIGMFLLKNYEVSHSGMMTLFEVNQGKLIARNLAVMNLYPLGFTLELNPATEFDKKLVDITKFADIDYNYNKKISIIANILDKEYSMHSLFEKIRKENQNGK